MGEPHTIDPDKYSRSRPAVLTRHTLRGVGYMLADPTAGSV